MFKINPGDRPIPNSEPISVAEQISETESVEKPENTGKTVLETQEAPEKPALGGDDRKSQPNELVLSGLARQAQLQSQLAGIPDRPNFDPNVHMDEKIDVTKNLPDGKTINSGLDGLNWGPNTAKSGPNHMGVDITTGGMKAPNDVIADVLNADKPAATTAPPPQNGRGIKTTDRQTGGNTGLVPGKSASGSNVHAPKWDLVSQPQRPTPKMALTGENGGASGRPLKEYVEPSDNKGILDVVQDLVDVWFEEPEPPPPPQKKDPVVTQSDPDAIGGADVTAEEMAHKVKVHFGSNADGINPDMLTDPPMTMDPAKTGYSKIINVDPDYIEGTNETPNLVNTAQPETRPDLQAPKPDMPSAPGSPNTGNSD